MIDSNVKTNYNGFRDVCARYSYFKINEVTYE